MIHKLVRFLQRGSQRVLGLNARNVDFLYVLNPRHNLPNADDKLRAKVRLEDRKVPTPRTLAVFATHRDLHRLGEVLPLQDGCVVKPARGAGGRGILVLRRRGSQLTVCGKKGSEVLSLEDLRSHIEKILSGCFCPQRVSDRAFLEELLRPEPAFEEISPFGLADLRLIVHCGRVVMGMLRIPTRRSRGKANLHQGAVGVGLELSRGITTWAALRSRLVTQHPDSGVNLAGFAVPQWEKVKSLGARAAEAVGLKFVGVDVAFDRAKGPGVLEVNARPGLGIQLANRQGLRVPLQEVPGAPPEA